MAMVSPISRAIPRASKITKRLKISKRSLEALN